MYDMTPHQQSQSVGSFGARARTDVAAYVRKVYLLFTGGIFFAIFGGLAALYLGEPVVLNAGYEQIAIPPVVAFGMQHWLLMLILYLGAFFGASFARRMPVLNVAALFGYAFVTGIFLAPMLFMAQFMASRGHTLSASPVRDALLLSGFAFTGLSAFAVFSRKDFSFLGAALNTGIWVLIGASLLGFFLHAEVFQLAIASVGVLLFAGYILYDTSRLIRDRSENDAVGAALRLFLDVVNLFIFILRIFSSSRDR
jgi:modulator of FtsH protease